MVKKSSDISRGFLLERRQKKWKGKIEERGKNK